MSSNSKISWTETTWNPVSGCSPISEGCRNCYARVMAGRLKAMGQAKYQNGFTPAIHPECLNEPFGWKGKKLVFVASMGDLFHKDIPFDFIDKVMEVIGQCPQHTFQILTKRADRMYGYFSIRTIPENVWLGVTVENRTVKSRIDYLKKLDAPVRFLSCEPLLEDLGTLAPSGIDWVIVGGESGNRARKVEKDWILNIKSQCDATPGVAFFFKQWGTWGSDGVKRSAKENGCLLDRKEYHAYPIPRKINP
jgi:putative ABC transporter subunit